MGKRIERQLYAIDFTISSLLRRKGKNGCLLFVYTIIIFLFASVLFYTQSLRQEARIILKESPEIIVQRTLSGRYEPIPISYMQKISEIRGVISVKPRLWGYYYDGAYEANYTLVVPDIDTPQTGTIDIGNGISKLRGLSKNDIIGLSAFDGLPLSFNVRNILSSESQLVSADLMVLSAADFRAFCGLNESLATDLVLKVRNPLEYSTIAEKIRRIYPDTRPIVRNEILRTYDAVFGWRSGVTLLILCTVLLSFFIFAWDKATGLSAEERKEIGILKAVGWETSDILLMKTWEGIIISFTAFLLGFVLAYVHVFLTSAWLFTPILKGWSTLYPQFRLIPFINLSDLFTLFFLSVVPYVISTIIPSWRIATIDPDSVMR